MLLFDDSKKLEKALGEDAAAVIAHAFERADEKWRNELATKGDLENGLLATKSELQAEIAALRMELKAEIASVRVEMQAMKGDIQRWLVGGFLAQSALLVAVIAFLR